MILKRHLPVIVGLFALSVFAAGFIGPADPISPLFYGSAIFPVALIAYLIGLWTAPPPAERSYRDKVKLAILASCLILISLLIASVAFQSMIDRTVPPESGVREIRTVPREGRLIESFLPYL
jgi:hypothetical protein